MLDFSFTDEQDAFRATVHEWVEKVCPKARARQLEEREHEYPLELWEDMTAAGFHGVGIPPEHGGEGGDVIVQMILARELGRSLAGLAWVWGITSFCAKSISAHGAPELRERMLPRIAAGQTRLAIAVTEPGGGTDVLGAMRTLARPDDDGWRVSGQKIWSTGALAADYLFMLVRTDARPAKPSAGLTIMLVPNPADGLEIREIPKLGLRSLGSCEVFLDDVYVPSELIVGDVGSGWYQMLDALNNERILVAAICCGVIEGVLEDALAYAKEREAFGGPIGRFQALQHYIADIATWLHQAELVTHHAAWLSSRGQPAGVESTMAKLIASEYATQAADTGIQILGGMGYAMETDMQRYWRDARLWRIGPITNEVAKNMIAGSLGLPRGG